MAEQWLSIVEYARTFAISDMTVRRRIKNGKLHAVLKEGKYFIPVSVAGQGGAAQQTPSAPAATRRQPGSAVSQAPQVGVIKGHPTAQNTFAPPNSMPPQNQMGMDMTPHAVQQHAAAHAPEQAMGDSPIPHTIRGPMSSSETSIVDTRALIAFCEATIKRSSEAERRQSEKFRYKMSTLEEQLRNKDQEINQLRQQIEDMKVLVDILEKRQ